MRWPRHIVACAAFFLIACALRASVPSLPRITVYSAWQDEFDMLWIGTQDGLFLYDGAHTEVFRPEEGNPASIYNNNIKDVCGDGNGNIYVISKFALCHYDRRSERFTTLRRTGVQAFCYGGGALWVASADTLFCLEGRALVPKYDFSTVPGNINTILYTSDGFIYAGTRTGLYIVDPYGKMATLDHEPDVLGLYEDSKKNIWVCTRRHGLRVFGPDGRRQELGHGDGLSSDYVRSVCEDAYGNYWIGTLDGLDIYDPTRGVISFSGNPELNHISVHKIIRDRQNSMWICTRGGVFMYNRENAIFTPHPEFFAKEGTNLISDFAEIGRWQYFSSVENGLLRRDGESGEVSPLPPSIKLSSSYVECICKDNGSDDLWVGTRFGGVNRVNLATGKVDVYLPGISIYRIGQYKNYIALGTQKGAVLLDKESGMISNLSSSTNIAGQFSTDLSVDDSGNCWVAVSEGLLRHNIDSGEEKEYFFKNKGVLGTNRIQTSFCDSKGRRWFGTTGSGLLLYDEENDGFHAYTTNNSQISNDYIWAINESWLGYILITNNDGLSKFDPENQVFYNYSSGTGFPQMSFLVRGIFVSRSGEIFVSGYRGLVSFREQQVPSYRAPGKLFFSSIEAGGRKLRAGDAAGVLQESLMYQDKVVLHGMGKELAITVSVPDYLKDNWMEYRLLGRDSAWARMKTDDKIVLDNLAPRKYTLSARCVDPSSGEESASDTLAIVVRAPWYLSLAAKALYLLLVILAAAGIFALFRRGPREGSVPAHPEPENAFMKKAAEVVRKHLTDSSFGVEEFASEMALGRTRLFQKLEAECGRTPGKFINEIRLEYAKELLESEENYSISEVSYMAGFSTPSYFIKCFKAAYGLTPSAFKAQ